MAEEKKSSAVKSLIGSILSKVGAARPEPATPAKQTAHVSDVDEPFDADQTAAELVEVYFELETPIERDVLFERISQIESPIADEFLLGMMEEDDSEYLRMAAADVLAQRGY